MERRLRIDRGQARPVYRQIADQLEAMIRERSIAPGGRLPTVREVARRLKVTLPTVHRAFSELRRRGLIDATVGRGTFARTAPGPAEASPSANSNERDDSLGADEVMAGLQGLISREGTIRMAGAEPDDALLAAGEFWDCLAALRPQAAELMRYQGAQGDPSLREALAAMAAKRGIRAGPDDIVITSGVTQGLSLALSALARPGDTVAVEEPTYLGLLGILRARGVRPVGVPLGKDGPDLDALERVVERDRPRFFYTIPAFQNPTGRCPSRANSRDLLALARRRRLLVLEDDIYHHLAYDRPAPPPLRAGDDDGLVVYLDGFSKVALPGARVGYIIAAPDLRARLLAARRADDLCGAPLLQRALAEFLGRGLLQTSLDRSLKRYRARRDALMEALAHSMPEGVEWTRPEGGFSAWLTLPPATDARGIYRAALSRGLAVTPGEVFFASPPARGHLRLCFSSVAEPGLRRGAALLGELVRQYAGARPAPPSTEWPALV